MDGVMVERLIPCVICEKAAFLVAIETAGDAYRCEDGHKFSIPVIFIESSTAGCCTEIYGYVNDTSTTHAARRI